MKERIEVVEGDITKIEVEAIVNAANERMLGGGGVDGAIHRAAGPELRKACERIPEVRPGVRCPTGEARITPAFNLPAKWVIHTVGPVWRGGGAGEENLLESCYRSCFSIIQDYGIRTAAFPAISTGVYRFPLEKATRIALHVTRRALAENPEVEKIVFACFGEEAAKTYRDIAEEVFR